MRKVFLEDLPRKGKLIDWKGSVNFNIKFIYDDIEDYIHIEKYDVENNILNVEYKDKYFNISTTSFKNCQIGRVLGKRTKEFKYDVGRTFEDDKRNITIIGREYKVEDRGYQKYNKKYYRYRCNICNWAEGVIEEGHLKRGQGCSCCAGEPVLGINTIWDTDRWMCDLGVSEEDAKSYTKGSHEKIKVKCPDCGKEGEVQIYNIFIRKSIGCTCGDGFSYPEKFIISVLNQLGVKFQTQLSKSTFKWCNKYKFDFYLPDYNCIIETHGLQHYVETKGFKRTLVEEQENDRIKERLAKDNGIENYIVLDCRYSEFDYVNNSVLNSELNELFDLSKIDWIKCEEFALRNTIKEVCDYWNSKEEWETTTTIADNNVWGISAGGTIARYLKRGNELGWCCYNPEEEIKKRRIKAKNSSAEKCGKRVQIAKDDEIIGVFKSASELARQSKKLFDVELKQVGISEACRDIKKYKGFTFRYV